MEFKLKESEVLLIFKYKGVTHSLSMSGTRLTPFVFHFLATSAVKHLNVLNSQLPPKPWKFKEGPPPMADLDSFFKNLERYLNGEGGNNEEL